MAWVFLAIAIASEVFATIMLKVSDGFSKLLPAIAVVAGYSFSFFMLALALKTIGLVVIGVVLLNVAIPH